MNMRAELTAEMTGAEIKASRQVVNETTVVVANPAASLDQAASDSTFAIVAGVKLSANGVTS